MENQPQANKTHTVPINIFALVPSIIIASVALAIFISSAIQRQTDQISKLAESVAAINNKKPEAVSYMATIKPSTYQAVFLKSGQVYFGKIEKMDSTFLTLTDIYYMRIDQTNQSINTTKPAADASLAKLGSEIHAPEDKMVISMGDISFYETLKSDGQVAKAIATYKSNH